MAVIWLTGLSGSGKTTIAKILSDKLKEVGIISVILDGDDVRKGLNSDLGFSREDRFENVRRIAHAAKILNESNIFVIVSVITPTNGMRDMAREIVGKSFILCYTKTNIKTCIQRDVKGLYKKALNKEVLQFTGISDQYEEPENFEIMLDTQNKTIGECTNILMGYLR